MATEYKTMRAKGFTIKQKGENLFEVKYEKWTFSGDFKSAGLWVWNMADNHDIGREVNHRMCEVYNRVFFDD